MTSRRRQNGQRGLLSALSLKPPANVLLDRSALYWSGGEISARSVSQAHLDSNMCSTDDWEDLQSSSFTSQLENIHKKAPDFLELQRFMFYRLPQMIFTHFLHAICFLFP